MPASTSTISWTTGHLSDRPQYVRLGRAQFDLMVCSTGAPQETVIAPTLFTFYASDLQYTFRKLSQWVWFHLTDLVTPRVACEGRGWVGLRYFLLSMSSVLFWCLLLSLHVSLSDSDFTDANTSSFQNGFCWNSHSKELQLASWISSLIS